MSKQLTLEGKVALVQGGSRGIGAAIVRRLAREVPEVRAGCGVTHVVVVAGYVGAADRFEYTVIGDPVNEAARLTELAKLEEGHVLASAIAVSGALDAEALCWDVGETVELRGRSAPTQLARPLSLASPRPAPEPETEAAS